MPPRSKRATLVPGFIFLFSMAQLGAGPALNPALFCGTADAKGLAHAVSDLQDQTDNLQEQVNEIELLEGPQGPPGKALPVRRESLVLRESLESLDRRESPDPQALQGPRGVSRMISQQGPLP